MHSRVVPVVVLWIASVFKTWLSYTTKKIIESSCAGNEAIDSKKRIRTFVRGIADPCAIVLALTSPSRCDRRTTRDVALYASTTVAIDDYHYHLPIVVVACIEELTKTGECPSCSWSRLVSYKYPGIYRSGLFRALPSRDRHLQLIDLFDTSPDFGAHFKMRGQAMPDVCALSVKREDARRDQQQEGEEDWRARGETLRPDSWMTRTDALTTLTAHLKPIRFPWPKSSSVSFLRGTSPSSCISTVSSLSFHCVLRTACSSRTWRVYLDIGC